MQYNYRPKNLVVIDGDLYVYKYEKCKFDQPFIFFQIKHIFIGKLKVCETTEFSGAVDSSDFNGKTILLECGDNECVYISGYEISKFKTDDKIIDYKSLMGNNMCRYANRVGEKYTYFIAHHYKFIENDKIEEGTSVYATNNNLDPFVYHPANCGKDSVKKLERSQIHCCWPHDDEEGENGDLVVEDDVLIEENEDLMETQFFNGKNEVVKIFIQKCVICYERDSVYAFRQCGHQCICEQCYQNKGDIDILKRVVSRTKQIEIYTKNIV